MSSLNSQQKVVLHAIKSVARSVGASPKEVKAAIETGIVETGLRNLAGGDADSAGWRQERASLYKDPTNLHASIARFFAETRAVKDKYGKAGDLAAAVQRPAAQYRGRYQQQSARADSLMGRAGHAVKSASTPRRARAAATPSREDKGRAAVAALLAKHNPNSLLLKTGVLMQADTPPRPVGGPVARPAHAVADRRGGLIADVQAIDRRAAAAGIPITARQEPGHAAGGDHDPAVKGATARDLGGSERQREAFFRTLVKTLGVKDAVYGGGDINVVKGGVRYQIISRDHGTGPHLHIGLRRQPA